MKRITTVAALAGFAIAISGDAFADERIDISGFGGVHVFSDNNELGQVDIDVADSPVNSLAFGMRVGIAFTDLFSAEGELAIMPTESRNTSTDVVVFGWRAQGLVHLMGKSSKIRPFAVLGVGALTGSSTDTDQFLNDTDGVIHGGIGAKLAIGDNWGVRADARILFPPSSDGEFATTDFEFFLSAYKSFPPVEKKPAADTQVGIEAASE